MFLSFFCISYHSQIIRKSWYLQESQFANNLRTIRDIEKISNLKIAQLQNEIFVFLHFDPVSNRLTVTSECHQKVTHFRPLWKVFFWSIIFLPRKKCKLREIWFVHLQLPNLWITGKKSWFFFLKISVRYSWKCKLRRNSPTPPAIFCKGLFF